MVRITQQPHIKQQFVMRIFDSVLARHDHNSNNDKARYRAGLVVMSAQEVNLIPLFGLST